jgi:hypothetical protein
MKPQKPQDIYVANGWYLNIPVPGIMSDAIFETLEGMQKQSGTVETVDAGTNRKYKFSTQLTDYGEMTLTRSYQGNATDRALEVLVNQMIENGSGCQDAQRKGSVHYRIRGIQIPVRKLSYVRYRKRREIHSFLRGYL